MRASLPVVHFVAIQTEAGGLQLHEIKCTGAAGLQSKTRPTSEQWFVGPVRFCRLGGSLNLRTRPRLRDGFVVPSGDDFSGDLKQSRRAAIEIGRPRVVQSSRLQHRRVFSLGHRTNAADEIDAAHLRHVPAGDDHVHRPVCAQRVDILSRLSGASLDCARWPLHWSAS